MFLTVIPRSFRHPNNVSHKSSENPNHHRSLWWWSDPEPSVRLFKISAAVFRAPSNPQSSSPESGSVHTVCGGLFREGTQKITIRVLMAMSSSRTTPSSLISSSSTPSSSSASSFSSLSSFSSSSSSISALTFAAAASESVFSAACSRRPATLYNTYDYRR